MSRRSPKSIQAVVYARLMDLQRRTAWTKATVFAFANQTLQLEGDTVFRDLADQQCRLLIQAITKYELAHLPRKKKI